MLNKEIFKEQLQRMADLYPSWKLDVTKASTVMNWYIMFENYQDEQFVNTVTSFCKTSKFPPTIAGIMECNIIEGKLINTEDLEVVYE